MVDFKTELSKFRKTMQIKDEEIINDGRPTIIEPDIPSVLSMMSRMFMSQNIYRLILEAKASEHSARTIAMKGATDNADALSNTLATIEKRYDNVMKEKVKQLDLYLERVKLFMDESMSTQEKK
jgi:F0F1-type ATP synthase gamma subunit